MTVVDGVETLVVTDGFENVVVGTPVTVVVPSGVVDVTFDAGGIVDNAGVVVVELTGVTLRQLAVVTGTVARATCGCVVGLR